MPIDRTSAATISLVQILFLFISMILTTFLFGRSLLAVKLRPYLHN